MKKLLLMVCMIIFAQTGVPPAEARPDQRYDPGTKTTRELSLANRRAGYAIFRKVCKNCHHRENKTAPFLHTESKTMKGWNTVFYKKYPKCAKQGYWDKLTAYDLLNLNDYLYYNALDAYDPWDPWDNDDIWLFRPLMR